MEVLLLLGENLLRFASVVVIGTLISALQQHLMGPKPLIFTVYDFIEGNYFWPISALIGILFIEVLVQKIQQSISGRREEVLQVANKREIQDHRATLDIARTTSKEFDDLDNKINELPAGWSTRIWFANNVMDVFYSVCTAAIFGASMLYNHPDYTAIIVGASLPMMVGEFIAFNRTWRFSLGLIPEHKRRSVLEQVFYGTTAFIQGKMFGQFPVLRKQIDENRSSIVARRDALRWANMRMTLWCYAVAISGLCFVLLHSVWTTITAAADLGALTVLIASARTVQGSLRAIAAQVARQWISAEGTILIQREFFGMKPLIQIPDPVRPRFDGVPTLRFENVTFTYPDEDEAVLTDVSFEVRPGMKVAIVGKSGSGKSSLAALILGLYKPQGGRIKLNDTDLSDIDRQWIFKYVSGLLQDFHILHRKIGDEIASSRIDEPADHKALDLACESASFGKVVRDDPQGYESQIGRRFGGREFSGGERQRLAMARVFYRNSPILILDEPDSALDPENAQRVIENVFSFKDKTVLMITQHVSRAERCDLILVMEEGELVESGTHSELLEKNGKYASLFHKDRERLEAD